MTKVVLNQAAIRAYGRSVTVRNLLERWGAEMAADAARDAPKRTGALAASLDYEVAEDARGAYVRVSWDDAHFYGRFAELGTSRQSATPFLRPAALKRRQF